MAAAVAAVPLRAAGPRLQPLRTDALPVRQVQDLHYGEALFHYYLDDDFAALVRLEAYEAWQRLPRQGREAALLSGGLHLSLGAHGAAARRFDAVLKAPVPVPVADRAWYHLAQLRYQRGLHADALQALERIQGDLSPTLQPQRVALHANTLMRLGRFDEAARRLAAGQGRDDWSAYAHYNLGVALIRDGRLEEARRWLEGVGTAAAPTAERLALRDRANLALGLALLQARRPQEAMTPLLRTRLDGPAANTALLGLGWAHAALDQPAEALVPWLELAQRPLLDAAVQEAWLAVPYAYARAGAAGQAVEAYERALQGFDTESAALADAAARLQAGSLFEGVGGLESAAPADRGWLWRLQQMPQAPEARYLAPLLAADVFQQGLQNLRDLSRMDAGLQRWRTDIVAFDDMIAARGQALATLDARVATLAIADPVEPLLGRNAALVRRLGAMSAEESALALSPAAQQAQWEQLRRLGLRVAGLPPGQVRDTLQEKLRLMRGVLLWDMQRELRLRQYLQQRESQFVQRGLAEAGQRVQRVLRAHAEAPGRTAGFDARLRVLQSRLAQLQQRLQALARLQEGQLTAAALQGLQAQQQRLEEYRIQARFELASLQDRATSAPATTPAAAPGAAP
ncbi:MAG: hypothetical protein RL026_687 [Pseudomonadota bacterium]|jgi:tetratricopeptide (TPR) repeat protein